MATVDPLVIKLTADVNDLKVGLAQAQSAIKGVDDNVKTASSGMSNFVTKLKQVGGAMGVAFAGQQVLKFGKDILMAASDMNESLGKMNVVFGQNAAEVEKWANTSATAMGLSKQGAVEAAGTYGNLFQAFGMGQGEATKMSTSLVQLAADMASFNNTSVDDALLALRSGLSGEAEPLKRYGVALNDVRLKQEAMSMGLIKSTSEALTPAIKAQASYALVMHDTKLAQGDFARTADGTANTMRILAAQMQNAKAALGAGLLPIFQAVLLVLKPIIAALAAFGNFLAKHADDVKVFTIAIAGFAAAWGIYTVAVNAAKIATGLLNAVLAVNPLVWVAAAIGIVAVGLYELWKRSEAFRKIVIIVAKAALTAFASIVPMVGQVYEVIMKVVTGPLKALLTVLSHLPGVGKYAKAGLDLMNKGLDGISDFAQGAANKANDLIAKLDKVGTAAEKSASKTKAAVKTTTDATDKKGGGGMSEKDQKKLEGYKKKVTDIYKDMNDVIKSYNEDAAKELADYNDKKIEAQKKYDEEYASLTKRKREADEADQKRYDETVLKIEEDYRKRKLSLEKDYNAKVADIRAKAADKSADLIKTANEKQLAIIKQGQDQLRNAFASKTGWSIADAFSGGANTTDKLLADLKAKLASIKTLQANAAKLAGLGYSQVFIEEVVRQGPEAGNKIAEALQNASPEATNQLQELYYGIEDVSKHGLDELAKQMSTSTSFATEEMLNAYNQVAIDLKQSLADTNAEMNKSLAIAQADYNDAVTEAMNTRNEALADAKKTLTEALAANEKAFNEGLAAAQKDLQDALLKAQEAYNKAIDELNAKTQKKLEDLKTKLAEVAAQMAALGAAQAAAQALANAPKAPTYVGTPFGQAGSLSGGMSGAEATARSVSATNITQVFNSNAAPDPYDVKLSTIAGIKYGTVVAAKPVSTVSAAKLKMMENIL